MEALERELEGCRKSAAEGYKLAMESVQEMKNALAKEEEELKKIANQQNNVERIKNNKQVKIQLKEIETFEKQKMAEVENNLHELHERMNDDFTIVLYGRTMAGKSTLMEILTHGDGSTIGKGGQRTTKDVRPYTWNGLKIFDVPGTCSFGGDRDDKKAYEAAKSADLALFLLTDDAPAPEEAHRLMELIKIGMPVLGIVNVKQTLSDKASPMRKINQKSLVKKIQDKTRLDDIVRQFKKFAQKYGYDFSNIKFVPSHLNAAYLAQPERENDAELYGISNFAAVEEYIVSTVQRNGCFYRMKTFLNSAARPMQTGIADMYRHSADTVNVYWTFNEKIVQLREWHSNFLESINNRYGNFIEDMRRKLDSRIEQVVDDYYDSENAGKAWQDSVVRLDINGLCQNFISSISNDATRKMHQLSDELIQDLRYGCPDIDLPDIRMDDITDWQGLGTLLAGGILFFELSNPIGWGILLGSLLFGDSKAEKIKKAKDKLREKLRESREEIVSKIDDKMREILNNKILHKQIGGFEMSLFAMRDMRKKLAYVQTKSAESINKSYKDLNLRLLIEVLIHEKIDIKLKKVTTARVIGQKLLIFATAGLDSQVLDALHRLMQEDIQSFKVKDEEYWNDVRNNLETSVLGDECHTEEFLNEDWGSMSVVVFQNIKKASENNIQLMQQLYDFPVRRM